MTFPVVMYRCENWTIKKDENWRNYAFKLWYWRRLFRVPWPARRSNQSILKEINPEYLLEGLMLKLQYFGHLMKSWHNGKDPDPGKDWGQEEKRVTEDGMVGWHHDSMDMNLSKLQEMVKDSEACHAKVYGVTKSWIPLSNWTKKNK